MDRQNILRNQRKLDEFKQEWNTNAVAIRDLLARMSNTIDEMKKLHSKMEFLASSLVEGKLTQKIHNFIAEGKLDGLLFHQVGDTSDFASAIKNLVTEHNEIVERKKLLDEAAADETGCGRYPAKLGMDGVVQFIEKLMKLCDSCNKVEKRAGQLASLQMKFSKALNSLLKEEKAELQARKFQMEM